MDVVFDIDGTLADATHRLHHIKDMAFWKCVNGKPPSPDWETFLSEDLVAKDTLIPQTWAVMTALMNQGARVIFITGRNSDQYHMTWNWLTKECSVRCDAAGHLRMYPEDPLYMRRLGDKRPSHTVKRELLHLARSHGYDPTLVFEDRIDDTKMWREEGLLCCQVAEGNY